MAMAGPMRLDAALIAAAEREATIQKRSIPKQIEFWAELGKALEHIIGMDDAIAVMQGLKKIQLEPFESSTADPNDVFNVLENSRISGRLSEQVTEATVYYEASKKHPGFLDQVEKATGKRETGRFLNGEFKVHK
jgi:hypothetical protein